MSEIRNLTRNGETFYPLTTTSAVINEATGEGLIIDDEPTPGSDNLVKSGGVAETYGYYKDGEDIWVAVDKKKRIVYIIEPDGNIRFGKVPNQIYDELLKKVDKEENKSLISTQYIQEFEGEDINLNLDSKKRILNRLKSDGTYQFSKLDALNIGDNLIELIKNIQNKSEHVPTSALCGLLDIHDENVGVDALVIDGTTLYFGGNGRPRIYVADFSNEYLPRITRYSDTDAKKLPTGHIKEMIGNGEYLYVCGRGNGSGLNNDTVFPEYYFPFEGNSSDDNTNVLGFDSYTHSGSATIDNTGDPAPSRFQHSAKLYKGSGTGSALLEKSASFGTGSLSLWINKVSESLTDTVYIPLLQNNGSNVLAIAINSSNQIGISINDVDTFSSFVLNEAWKNVKIVITNSSVMMYIRYKECNADWGNAIATYNVSNLTADTICVGINTSANNVTILVDDLAFDSGNIDEKMAIDGFLSIVMKSDLSIAKTFMNNLRCLSMIQDGDILYMGILGGINVYNVSDQLNPVLIGYNRESLTWWSYPKDPNANYHYKVYGSEAQRMCLMTNGSSKYLVCGCDANGINIYDITDPANITLYKSVRDIPYVQAKNTATGEVSTAPQYVEWGVYAEYPYIYSTVASTHSLQNGNNVLLHPDRDTIYGMKVRDITNINDIKTKIINIPKEWYNAFYNTDGDSRPTSLAMIGEKIVMGNANKGILVFSVDGMNSEFVYGKEMPRNGRTNRMFIADDGRVFATDYTSSTAYPDCFIYLLRGIK